MKTIIKTASACILLMAASFGLAAGDHVRDMSEAQILTVSGAGIAQLKGKVSTRPDVSAANADKMIERYVIADRNEEYYFTTEGHPAHPTAMFRGIVERDDGTSGLDLRAWSGAANKEALKAFVAKIVEKGREGL